LLVFDATTELEAMQVRRVPTRHRHCGSYRSNLGAGRGSDLPYPTVMTS
jgi:hypothetical protein